MVQQVSALFQGHEGLLRGFQNFLMGASASAAAVPEPPAETVRVFQDYLQKIMTYRLIVGEWREVKALEEGREGQSVVKTWEKGRSGGEACE